jgi:DNA-binding transcriptional regulator YdaS (Cro superfamily)
MFCIYDIVLQVRKEKVLTEDKDEFSLMVGNEKSLADRLGTSPDDIEKKLNAKRKGMNDKALPIYQMD